jgi:hypothetical protein
VQQTISSNFTREKKNCQNRPNVRKKPPKPEGARESQRESTKRHENGSNKTVRKIKGISIIVRAIKSYFLWISNFRIRGKKKCNLENVRRMTLEEFIYDVPYVEIGGSKIFYNVQI